MVAAIRSDVAIPLAVVTDELSADPETALELAAEMGIHAVELRGIGPDRFPRVAEYWQQRLPGYLVRFDMRVISMSPGLFKIPLAPSHEPLWPDRGLRWRDWERHTEWRQQRDRLEDHAGRLLQESLDWARRLECPTVSCFSFLRPADAADRACPQEVIAVLHAAAEQAQLAGVTLVLENEHVCYGDTGAAAAAIIDRVAHPNLALLWDPTNAYTAGETPYPDGYERVRGRVRHVQFKDARRLPGGGYEYVTRGGVDWEGQIAALRRDGYSGYISIETHATPKVAGTRAHLERLRMLLEGDPRAAADGT